MPTTARAVRSAPLRSRYRSAGFRELPTNPLRLERRREEREPATGTVAAAYKGLGRYGITQLEIVDRSPGGMGVRTRTAIEPGMTVTICPEGSTIPWLCARAERCNADGHGGFRVGLVFERRFAA